MKAVALMRYLPTTDSHTLFDIELEKPTPVGRDILVKVGAVSVNPIDVWIRPPMDNVGREPRVLGWDVAGIIEAVGTDVSLFEPGDAVFYAGDISRQGANSEFHLVDERIVGRMPKLLNFSESAALPLTTITAWNSLFLKLGISPGGKHEGRSILIIGAAGGVGSIAIQLASRLAKLTVIATASRPASIEWVRQQGADYVVNHFYDIPTQVRKAGFKNVDYTLILNEIDEHFLAATEVTAPGKAICSVVKNSSRLPMDLLISKNCSFHLERSPTRQFCNSAATENQHHFLNTIADLIDSGIIFTTRNEDLGTICAANLHEAHRRIEERRVIGKLTLTGF
jgi:zinc-binding alcohol dehydrogenase family protein